MRYDLEEGNISPLHNAVLHRSQKDMFLFSKTTNGWGRMQILC